MANNSNRLQILVICGSTRTNSSNLQLIHAIVKLWQHRAEFVLYEGLTQLPHFNPDLDHDAPPIEVEKFRNTIKPMDGILICTPEYAMGVPGTLKNALDWTVSSMEFSHKPVALITASSLGEKAHASLLSTLRIIESNIPDEHQLLISFVKTKIKGNEITDVNTLNSVQALMHSFLLFVQNKSWVQS